MFFADVGFGNIVAAERIVLVSSPDSSPVKRLIQDGKDSGRVIDLSCGHKTKSVIVTDSEHIILSGLTVEKIRERLNGKETEGDEEV